MLTGACACLAGVLRATGREKGRLSVDWEVRSRRLNCGESLSSAQGSYKVTSRKTKTACVETVLALEEHWRLFVL